MPDPKTPEHVDAACRLLLSVPLGEQLAAGGTADQYITADREEVRRALELSKRLGPGHPVDHLERVYDDLHATLASPRIWHCVSRLAETLRKDRLILGDRCASVLKSAMADHCAVASPPMPPRKVYIADGPRRNLTQGASDPTSSSLDRTLTSESGQTNAVR
jgi:hypothetical protein